MMNQEKIQELVSRSQQDDKRAFALTGFRIPATGIPTSFPFTL